MKIAVGLEFAIVVGLMAEMVVLRAIREKAAARAGLRPQDAGPGSEWWKGTLRDAVRLNRSFNVLFFRTVYLQLGGLTVFVMGAILSFKSTPVLVASFVGLTGQLAGLITGAFALARLRNLVLK